jgi:pimeloyl-ACP methyl ester carboxylesterase
MPFCVPPCVSPATRRSNVGAGNRPGPRLRCAARALLGLAGVVLAACRPAPGPAPAPSGPAPVASRVAYLRVGGGVRAQYLDWGGPHGADAVGLVFLHGLGDSPHAYDAIAPAFADRFRVVAYARRGHGGSEARGPWDVATLAEDVRALLDTLGVRRAVLVGWSMGGLEIAELAARYPERVAGAVFLDSYDLSGPAYDALLRDYPVPSAPSPDDLASRAAFRRWWKASSAPSVPWSPAMAAEVDDIVDTLPGGRVRLRPTDSLQNLLVGELRAYHPRYELIRAPLLVFWARPWVGAFLGPDAPDTLRARVARWIGADFLPWQDSARTRLARLAPTARVVVLDSTGHAALPFQRGEAIVDELRRFLAPLATASISR